MTTDYAAGSQQLQKPDAAHAAMPHSCAFTALHGQEAADPLPCGYPAPAGNPAFSMETANGPSDAALPDPAPDTCGSAQKHLVLTPLMWQAILSAELSANTSLALFEAVMEYVSAGSLNLRRLLRKARPVAVLLCGLNDAICGRVPAALPAAVQCAMVEEKVGPGNGPERNVPAGTETQRAAQAPVPADGAEISGNKHAGMTGTSAARTADQSAPASAGTAAVKYQASAPARADAVLRREPETTERLLETDVDQAPVFLSDDTPAASVLADQQMTAPRAGAETEQMQEQTDRPRGPEQPKKPQLARAGLSAAAETVLGSGPGDGTGFPDETLIQSRPLAVNPYDSARAYMRSRASSPAPAVGSTQNLTAGKYAEQGRTGGSHDQ